jgi:hypothetical protein
LEETSGSVEECLVGGKGFWVGKLVSSEIRGRGLGEGRIFAKEKEMGEETEAAKMVDSEGKERDVFAVYCCNDLLIGE